MFLFCGSKLKILIYTFDVKIVMIKVIAKIYRRNRNKTSIRKHSPSL